MEVWWENKLALTALLHCTLVEMINSTKEDVISDALSKHVPKHWAIA